MKASELARRIADTIATHGDVNVTLIITPESGPTLLAQIEPSVIHDEPIELVPFYVAADGSKCVAIRGFAGQPVRQWHDVAMQLAAL